MSNPTEKNSTTKLIAVFFPLKPLKNKFSDNFISIQIADFIPKLRKYSDKAIIYKIDKERFYTYDLKKETFDDNFEVVDNQTVVVIFSVDKTLNVDVEEMFESDFSKSVNTIRIHRKRIDPKQIEATKTQKPSYIFYTINSTKLLNSIIPLLQNDSKPSERGETYFILSANNAKRDIDPLERAFSTEKICRMNYVTTIALTEADTTDDLLKFKRKVYAQIKI